MIFLAISTPTALILSSLFSSIGLLVAISSLRLSAKRGVVDDLKTQLGLLEKQISKCEDLNKEKSALIEALEKHSAKQDDSIKALEDERAKARDREFALLMEIHDMTKKIFDLEHKRGN